ncbi:hypothetical protein ACLOJK_038032 [Asimina triloba]
MDGVMGARGRDADGAWEPGFWIWDGPRDGRGRCAAGMEDRGGSNLARAEGDGGVVAVGRRRTELECCGGRRQICRGRRW